ncbi:MAG: FtsX-like permease family protein [Thermomicrobiales bacterium]
MDSIFGLSMTTIMLVVVAIMALCLLTTVVIALRNPVIFRMALRNIPRRKAQTILIMVGLMLATLIIAASLTTGDSIDHSITSSAYKGLGEVDITVAYVGGTGGEGTISVNNVPIDASIADQLDAKLKANPDIDGIMPVLTETVPILNVDKRLSQPAVVMTGLDPARVPSFGGMKTTSGKAIDFAAVTAGSEPLPAADVALLQQYASRIPGGLKIDPASLQVFPVVLSNDLAQEINATDGDLLVFFYNNQAQPVRVAAIASGSIMTGFAGGGQQSSGIHGFAMPLAEVQRITNLEGKARYIAISNRGGVEGGIALTDAVVPAVKEALAGIPGGSDLGVNPIKQDAIKGAETFGNVFMSLFIVLGLFSVAAGVLLIFLIFMMLAAERRSEMGMARAVGMKRRHLIQGFIAEGTAYDLGAALLGAAAGVGVAFAIAGIMGRLLGDFISIAPYATWRSLVVAYSLGVSVTFVTILFASVRSSRLNIVAAIRDLPEEAHASRDKRPAWNWWSKLPRVGPSIGISLISILWFPLEVIWNVLLSPVKAAIWLLRMLAVRVGWGPAAAVVGALLMLSGMSAKSIFQFSSGLTFVALGLSLFLSRYLPKRAVYTFFSAAMLIFWLLPQGWSEKILPNLGTGGMEMFFVSGLSMVTFATLIIMWNAEMAVGVVGLFGRVFSRWIPAVKTAIAYPISAKGRTGLTIAMFSMVIFSLVTLTTINANFVQLFSTDKAGAGWDISVTTSPANPIADLKAQLAGSKVNLDDIQAVGRVNGIAYANTEIRNVGTDTWKHWPISGMDDAYMAAADIPLEAWAAGYASDADVWKAIKAGEKVAIIDANALSTQGFGDPEGFHAPDGVKVVDGSFPAFQVEIGSSRSDKTDTWTIIGVIDSKVSMLAGVYTSDQVFSGLFGGFDSSMLFVQLTPAARSQADTIAKEIESTLLTSGVQADAIQKLLEGFVAVQTGIFKLLQGFMGLGLFVGIAALGVISFRSVVERRQQIGMLRAIGYQRNMVAASFLLESLVIAGLGVVSGTVLALILSYNLMHAEDFTSGQSMAGFVVPWGTVIFFVVASLVAATIMTWIPARKAASVPIAEALRYE